MTPVYYGFPTHAIPTDEGTYLVGVERLADIEDEIRPVHEAHYSETETRYLDVPFLPDYERYKEVEARNQFVMFTVRRSSTIVGYLQYYVYRDMHSQGTFTAREDAFYLAPESRGKGLAPQILSYAEHCLQQLGCRYVGMSSKAPSGGVDMGRFLSDRGYREVAIYYVKELESDSNVLPRPAAAA